MGNPRHRLVMRHVHRYRHQLLVHGDIEKFFPIRTPARLCATMVRYLDSPAWAVDRRDIHFGTLLAARTAPGESYPFPIWRKLCRRARSEECLRMVKQAKNSSSGGPC